AYREELFGPVAVVYKVSTDDEAVQLANVVDFGLGGAVWSTDEERAIKVAGQLEVGMANVNTPAGEGADLPFGGTKRSGFGRELGPSASTNSSTSVSFTSRSSVRQRAVRHQAQTRTSLAKRFRQSVLLGETHGL